MPPRSGALTLTRPKEAFFSRAERETAPVRASIRRLERTLARHGVRFWTAPARVMPAQTWHDEIGRALGRCDWFLLALSKRAVGREWVKREVLFALQEKRYRDRIIPLVFEPCDAVKLSWTLRSFQAIDFVRNFDDGCRRLLRVWGIEALVEPSTRAPRPRGRVR